MFSKVVAMSLLTGRTLPRTAYDFLQIPFEAGTLRHCAAWATCTGNVSYKLGRLTRTACVVTVTAIAVTC